MKNYFLSVACYNHDNGASFKGLCENRIRYLLHRTPSWAMDSDVEFILFDVKAGKIEKYAVAGARRVWSIVNDSFTPINRALHYDGTYLKVADTSIMSIRDVYNFIMQTGQTEPNSITEVSFMGHGWMGGPILANSFERLEYQPNGANPFARDPWDKDGRPKDANLENMPLSDWISFFSAFKNNGYFWLWGCNFPRLIFKILHRTLSEAPNRKANVNDYAESDIIQFSFSQSWANEHYGHFPGFFPPLSNGVAAASDLRFTRTFKQVKDFIKLATLYSYAGLFPYNSRISCVGAMLGTYADYEVGTASSRSLMVIPKSVPPYSDNFSRIIAFHKIHLQVPEDAENRGFGIHTPDQMTTWWTELSVVV